MLLSNLLNKIDNFYKLAMLDDFFTSEISIDPSGMRNESLDIVRKQRKSNILMRPVEIEVYPNYKPFLADGRHRLAIARELNEKFLNAIVRYYDEEGNVIDKKNTRLIIND